MNAPIKKIAVIGCGNMARALVLGMARDQRHLSFTCYTPSFQRAEALAMSLEQMGLEAQAVRSLSDLGDADLYLLGLKPQQFPLLVGELKASGVLPLPPSSLVVSMLAALSVGYLQRELNHRKVVRVMPNTPTTLGLGALLFYFSPESADAKSAVSGLFSSCGESFVLPQEEHLEIATPYTGSGPALVFEWARILSTQLHQQGLPLGDSEKMVAKMLMGASAMLERSSLSALELREQVTSKKGMTLEALKVFEEEDLARITARAITAAQDRAREIAAELQP